MTAVDLSGVLAIPVTPFTDDDRVDRPALARQVETFIAHGADVIVGPVFVSEFFTLTDNEFDEFIETVVETVAGRVPVLAGVSRPATAPAVTATKRAVALGADAVIALPPFVQTAPTDGIIDYYLRIAQACDGVPLMIQNAPQPPGVQLTAAQMRAVIDASPVPTWVKEETTKATILMGDLTADPSDNFGGVGGGIAGLHLLEEFMRGSVGTMPGGAHIDMHSRLWKQLAEHGPEHPRTQEMYAGLLPLLVLEQHYGITVCKEVLVMRGVLTSTAAREPQAGPLNPASKAMLHTYLERACEIFEVDYVLV